MPELTTVSAIKAQLGITDSTDDAVLTALLDQAEAVIRDRCNRPNGWTKTTQTETLPGRGSDSVVLTYTPIDTTASFTAQIVVPGSTTYTLPSTSYELNADTGELRILGGYAWGAWWDASLPSMTPMDTSLMRRPTLGDGIKNVSLAYTGGYTTIPATLTRAATFIVTAWYLSRKVNPNLSSEKLGEYAYVVGKNPDSAVDIAIAQYLDDYVRRSYL